MNWKLLFHTHIPMETHRHRSPYKYVPSLPQQLDLGGSRASEVWVWNHNPKIICFYKNPFSVLSTLTGVVSQKESITLVCIIALTPWNHRHHHTMKISYIQAHSKPHLFLQVPITVFSSFFPPSVPLSLFEINANKLLFCLQVNFCLPEFCYIFLCF